MRIVSYILMQLAPGKARSAAEAISKIGGVKMAHAVTGPFDVIAFAEVPDLTALSELVLAKIQTVEGVEKTQTAVVVAPEALSGNIPRTRVYKAPPPPKGWVEGVVGEIVQSNQQIVESPLDLLKRVREEARRNGYRPVIAPAQVQAIINRLRESARLRASPRPEA